VIAGAVAGPSTVRVRVPATSANLGPGFDSLGMALRLHDDVEVRVVPDGGAPGRASVATCGESAADFPRDESNLIAHTTIATMRRCGVEPPYLDLTCATALPHGRGLGSSAAAIVAGVLAGRTLAARHRDPDAELALAADLEGHPDNVAACVYGGVTISWNEAEGQGHERARAVRIPVHPDIVVTLAVPGHRVPTSAARAMLPASVTHDDAVFTGARAALLVQAMSGRPDLLLPATADRIHQDMRGGTMPQTLHLVHALRRQGIAAVVSGAGPSVLALATTDLQDVVAAEAGSDWRVAVVDIDGGGAQVLEPHG